MLGVWSCGDNPKTDSKAAAQELNKPNSDPTKESDERFLVNATEYAFKEILIGKLAQQRSTNQQVIELGKTMENAHRELKSALGSLAIVKSIAIPHTAPQSALASYDKLNEKSKSDFNLEYCAMTIQDHKDAISLFENAERGNHDPDIQALATSMLTAMRARLSQAEACQSHLNPVSELIR